VRYPAPAPVHANVVRAFSSACQGRGITQLINALSKKPSFEGQTDEALARRFPYMNGKC